MNVGEVGLPPPHRGHHIPAERGGLRVPHIQQILGALPTQGGGVGATLRAQVQQML